MTGLTRADPVEMFRFSEILGPRKKLGSSTSWCISSSIVVSTAVTPKPDLFTGISEPKELKQPPPGQETMEGGTSRSTDKDTDSVWHW